ncbi:MAG: hypothetical protein ABIL09_02105, partial [Gemmatimonadota bacterium]
EGEGPYLLSKLGDRLLIAGDRHWRDVTIRARVRQFFSWNISPSVNLSYRDACLNGLACRIRDVRSYYFLCLEDFDRVTLYRIEDDEQIVLGQVFVPLDRTRFHLLEARCRGDRLTCLLDGREVFAPVDATYSSGWFGLRSNAKAGFLDAEVTADEEAWQGHLARLGAGERQLASLREQYPQPVFQRQIPRPFEGPGSLQLRRVEAEDAWGFFWTAGDGRRVAAADLEGQLRWTVDLEGPAPEDPAPISLKAADVDGDGHDDLLLIDHNKVKLFSGRTGELVAERPLPLSGPLMGVPGRTAPIGYLYAVRFRPAPAPLDIIILDADAGGGRNVWCYDHQLRPRWHRLLPFAFGHNMHFLDVDGDGRDEAMIGHCLLNGDGDLLWSLEEMHYAPHGAMGIHADSVVLGDLEGNGALRLASVSGDDGVLFADAATGEILRRDRIGHAQGITAARYVRDEPGIQVLAGTRHRAYGIFVLYNGKGDRLHRWQPDFVNQNGRPVNWTADGEELLLLSSPDSGTGLFDWRGRLVVPFGEELRRATVIPHPLAAGDPRDQLLAVTPERIALYTQDRPIPAGQEQLFSPVRHYWRGNTIGVISHPRWVARPA